MYNAYITHILYMFRPFLIQDPVQIAVDQENGDIVTL